MQAISLDEYYTLLEKHDWYYQYSDDHRVFRKGQESYSIVSSLSKQSPAHKNLFEGFHSYYHHLTESKPARPNAA